MQSSTLTACHSESSGKSVLRWGARLALPLLLALPGAAWCVDNKASKCLAEICLQTPVTQKDIVAKYGSGREYAGYPSNPGHVQRCYYDPKQDLYIEFTFDKHQQEQVVYNSDLIEIMVSSVPMCAKKYTPRQPFPPFKTEHGVSVGATEAEVQAALGKPRDAIDMVERERLRSSHGESHEALMKGYVAAEYGEKALSRALNPQDSLLTDYFYISQGKVKSILISNSE